MATTAEIKGLFSKEHIAIVLLVVGCYLWNYQTYKQGQTILLQQAEIKASIIILNFRLDAGNKGKLAFADAFGQERKTERETLLNVSSGFVYNPDNLLSSGYRVHKTGGNPDRYNYHVCGS